MVTSYRTNSCWILASLKSPTCINGSISPSLSLFRFRLTGNDWSSKSLMIPKTKRRENSLCPESFQAEIDERFQDLSGRSHVAMRDLSSFEQFGNKNNFKCSRTSDSARSSLRLKFPPSCLNEEEKLSRLRGYRRHIKIVFVCPPLPEFVMDIYPLILRYAKLRDLASPLTAQAHIWR